MATVGTKWLCKLLSSHKDDSMALLLAGSFSFSRYGSASTKNQSAFPIKKNLYKLPNPPSVL
jgi:hypothetical protein